MQQYCEALYAVQLLGISVRLWSIILIRTYNSVLPLPWQLILTYGHIVCVSGLTGILAV